MGERPVIYKDRNVAPLLDLIERRFDVCLTDGPIDHLREVQQHYRAKRELMLAEHGESAVKQADYAKAFLISEAARLMILREIQPRPKKRNKK